MNYELVFESERIKYIKLSEYLIDEYLKMVNDPEVSNKISHNPITFTKEQEQEWVQAKLKENATCYSMIEKDTNEYIGNIELMNIENAKAEIGITITPLKQNKHFGTEAMKAMVDYGYNTLKLNKIYLNVYSDNYKAIKCYKNAGFVETGEGKAPTDINMTHCKYRITNEISTDDFMRIRKELEWNDIQRELVEKAIKGSMFNTSVFDNDKCIAVGRLVGDHALKGMLTDIMVLKEYQGKEIGKIVVTNLLKQLDNSIALGECFQLEASPTASNREFYVKCGLKYKPENQDGVYLWIRK